MQDPYNKLIKNMKPCVANSDDQACMNLYDAKLLKIVNKIFPMQAINKCTKFIKFVMHTKLGQSGELKLQVSLSAVGSPDG